MNQARAFHCPARGRLSRPSTTSKGLLALSHLRQRRRRQVDADRPASAMTPSGCSRIRRLALRSAIQPQIRHPRARNLDFALLVDGLEAEREQGITIDVAYRFFATEKRKFIVADTPGHEQYTRNMATGASNSDLAVILIDARKGVLHPDAAAFAFIVSLLGIRHVVACGQQDGSRRPSTRHRFRCHPQSDYRRPSRKAFGFETLQVAIPMSAP